MALWFASKKTDKRNTGSIVWVCRCDCGEIEEVAGYRLTSTKKKTKKTECRKCSSAKAVVDLTGKKIFALTVLKRIVSSSSKSVLWECRCDCGAIDVFKTQDLTQGSRRRCRSCAKKLKTSVSTKHLMCHTRTYKSWSDMLSRCQCQTNPNFPRYGGRGISICDRWKDFNNFLEDMGERPEGMTLDRIDVNGNYEPSNCRWATPQEQALNRRSNVLLTLNGKTQTLSQWSAEIKIDSRTIKSRILRGWTEHDALTKPPRKSQKRA